MPHPSREWTLRPQVMQINKKGRKGGGWRDWLKQWWKKDCPLFYSFLKMPGEGYLELKPSLLKPSQYVQLIPGKKSVFSAIYNTQNGRVGMFPALGKTLSMSWNYDKALFFQRPSAASHVITLMQNGYNGIWSSVSVSLCSYSTASMLRHLLSSVTVSIDH